MLLLNYKGRQREREKQIEWKLERTNMSVPSSLGTSLSDTVKAISYKVSGGKGGLTHLAAGLCEGSKQDGRSRKSSSSRSSAVKISTHRRVVYELRRIVYDAMKMISNHRQESLSVRVSSIASRYIYMNRQKKSCAPWKTSPPNERIYSG